MSEIQINHFIAQGNAVIGIEDASTTRHLVCLCYGVPGLGNTGADVAQVIAGFLNTLNADAIRGIGFSLPEEKGQEHDSD